MCQKDYFLQIVCLVMMLNKSYIFLPDSSSRAEYSAEEHLREMGKMRCFCPGLSALIAYSPSGWRGIKLKTNQRNPRPATTCKSSNVFPSCTLFILQDMQIHSLKRLQDTFTFVVFSARLFQTCMGRAGKTLHKTLPHLTCGCKQRKCWSYPCLQPSRQERWGHGMGNRCLSLIISLERWKNGLGKKKSKCTCHPLTIWDFFPQHVCLCEIKVCMGVLFYKTCCVSCSEMAWLVYWSWPILTIPCLKNKTWNFSRRK